MRYACNVQVCRLVAQQCKMALSRMATPQRPALKTRLICCYERCRTCDPVKGVQLEQKHTPPPPRARTQSSSRLGLDVANSDAHPRFTLGCRFCSPSRPRSLVTASTAARSWCPALTGLPWRPSCACIPQSPAQSTTTARLQSRRQVS